MVTRNTRMRLTAAAVAGVLTLSAAGCSAGGQPSVGPVTTVMGMNSGLVPQFQAYVDVYNSIDPDFQVELETIPDVPADYIQQLVTQNISGDLPDIIFNFDVLNQQLAGNNLLYDLRPWLEEGRDGLADDFIPAFLDQYIADPESGAIGGLPVSADSTMLFYNRTLFEKAGVSEFPEEDWTWEDVYRVAQEISAAGAGQYWGLQTPVATGFGSAMFVDYPFLTAGGSQFYSAEDGRFDFGDADGIATWEFLTQPLTEGWGTPLPSGDETVDYFGASQAAMALDTRPAISRYRDGLTDDWDVINVPTYNGASTVGGGSYGLSISQASENKEAAWRFLAWFFSTDGGLKEAEPNGVIPATEDGLANGSWRDDANPVPAGLLAATEYAVENAGLPPALPDETSSDLGAALTEALQKVVINDESVESAYTAAQDSLNSALD